jgi:hypothetical protein
MSIYLETRFEYRPDLGERVYFWTGRGSQGYARVLSARWHDRLGCELFLLEPEPSATRGADYWPRNGRPYWGPRDFGVMLEQLEHAARIWYLNF